MVTFKRNSSGEKKEFLGHLCHTGKEVRISNFTFDTSTNINLKVQMQVIKQKWRKWRTTLQGQWWTENEDIWVQFRTLPCQYSFGHFCCCCCSSVPYLFNKDINTSLILPLACMPFEGLSKFFVIETTSYGICKTHSK